MDLFGFTKNICGISIWFAVVADWLICSVRFGSAKKMKEEGCHISVRVREHNILSALRD